MALSDRLNKLRREAGAGTLPDDAGPAGLATRVQRLRPHSTGPSRPTSKRIDDAGLAERLQGEVLAPGLIVIEQRVSLSTRHGALRLSMLTQPPGDLPEAQGLAPERLVFLDTETTGLSGGSGTAVFLLGLARVRGDALVVRQYLLTAFRGEAAMLEAGSEWLGDAQAVVTFNGKSFDMPLLAARCRLARVEDPYSTRPHVDLVHPTRRAFASRWDDCRLGTAERRLFDFRRIDDLPGSEAPAAWFDFVHRGEAGRLPDVARHNHWDLVSLAALLPVLSEVHADPAAWQADVLGIARARLRDSDQEQALSLLRAAQAELGHAGLLELARLYRRRRAWAQACIIWERLAAQGCPESLESLAKYHEHVRRDLGTALDYAQRLPALVAQRRCQRLRSKLGQQLITL